jgi:hypothetical protein
MTLQVPLSGVEALGFDLSTAIADFRAALDRHSRTINEPAPTAHPLVEEIVRGHGGSFEVHDDRPVPTETDRRGALFLLIEEEASALIASAASPARLRLAAADMNLIGPKAIVPQSGERLPGVTYRTPEEQSRVDEITALFNRINRINRHAALLMVEVEDIDPDQISAWQPHDWPEA